MNKKIRELLKKPSIHIVLIIAVGLFAYSNTFDVPFQFDDGMYIIKNSVIKDLQYFKYPAKVKDIMASNVLLHRTFKTRFIGYFSFALNYKLHGLNVTGYHIFNLTIHILNAILVYFLIMLTFTFKTPYFRRQYTEGSTQSKSDSLVPPFTYSPLFIALLFICHPVQTQAVTYISQRITSLATFFYLLSVVMYINFRLWVIGNRLEGKSPPYHLLPITYYLLSILFAVLAMKTKEISFTLPIVITLYEFMFFEGKIKRRSLYLIPLVLTMLIIPLSRIGTEKPFDDLIGDVSDATKELTTMSRWDYLFTQFRVIVTYIRLLFFPVNQNLDYDYPIYTSFLDPNVFLSFLFLLSIFGLGVYLLIKGFKVQGLKGLNNQPSTFKPFNIKLISFGIFWFFITLSVESSVIPIIDVIFEHRVYLPSVGAIIAFSTAIFYILFKIYDLRVSYLLLPTIYCLLSTTIIIFSIATYQRNIVWQDKVTLWEDAIRESPYKARPYNELGLAYMDKGNPLNAVLYFERALAIEPNLALAHSNLGNAFDDLGYIDYAMIEYQKAIEINPEFETAHYNLGRIYYKKGMFEEAAREFKIAIFLNPLDRDAKRNLELIVRTTLLRE